MGTDGIMCMMRCSVAASKGRVAHYRDIAADVHLHRLECCRTESIEERDDVGARIEERLQFARAAKCDEFVTA